MFMIFLLLFLCESSLSDFINEDRSTIDRSQFQSYPVQLGNQHPHYFKTLKKKFKREIPESEDNYSDKLNTPNKPEYKNVGLWAKGKTPVNEVELQWIPLQIYTQVRRTNTEKHLPKEAAFQDAATSEEFINAPRLKEVLRHKKIQQVYEEEGFEDSGYDHGGYNHQGAMYTDINKQDAAASTFRNEKLMKPKEHSSDNNNNSSQSFNQYQPTNLKDNYADGGAEVNKFEETPFHLRSRFLDKHYGKQFITNSYPTMKEEHEKISKFQNCDQEDESIDSGSSDKLPPISDRVNNMDHSTIESSENFPERKLKRNYVYFKIGPTLSTRMPYLEKMNNLPKFHYSPSVQVHMPGTDHYLNNDSEDISEIRSPSHIASRRYSIINSKPKWYKEIGSPVMSMPESIPIIISKSSKSIHDNGPDTLAAYATVVKQNMTGLSSMQINKLNHIEPFNGKPLINYTGIINKNSFKESPTEWLPLTQATEQPSSESREGRELFEHKMTSKVNNPSMIYHSDNSSDVMKNTLKVFLNPNDTMKAVKYIEKLTIAHFSTPVNHMNVPQIKMETKQKRATQIASVLNVHQKNYDEHVPISILSRRKRDIPFLYNKTEYPFYEAPGDDSISQSSALRYATNPLLRPDKTKGGMAFYELKDKTVKCGDPEPPEKIIPERDKDGEWNKNPHSENQPRIKSLGEKILCFKKKYFGENPFDNPFFQERMINNLTFDLDSTIEDHIAKASLYAHPNISTNKRIMVIPEYEEQKKNKFSSNGGIEIKGNQRKPPKLSFKNYKHKSEDHPVHYLKNTPPYDYQDEHNKQYSTYDKPEEIRKKNIEETKKKRKFPYGYYVYKKSYPKMRKRYRPRPYTASVYPVNGHYYPEQHKPYSNKNYRIIPVYELKNIYSDDNMGSYSQNNYITTTDKYYIIRPGEYTQNKELLNTNKGSANIWNYMNPLRWWFPNLFDNRRKEPKYRNKREMQQDKIVQDDTQEQIIPSNHKVETTTGPPISLAEFKARYNITSKPNKLGQLNMILGGFLNSNNKDRYDTDEQINSPSTIDPFVTQITSSPSIETTTRSTIATSPKSIVQFPRTNNPKKKINTRKPVTIKRGGQKYLLTTTSSITAEPNSTTRQEILSRKNLFVDRKINNYKKPRKNIIITTTQLPLMLSEKEEKNNENPRKFQQLELRKMIVKEEKEINSNKPAERLESVTSNRTLTYLVNPTTGNGSWKYTRKMNGKPENRRVNGEKKQKSQRYKESKQSVQKADKVSSTTQSNEAYIIGLLNKVPPGSIDRKQFRNRRRPQLEEISTKTQIKNGYVPINNTSIPLNLILKPDKRKYYYVTNK